MLNSNRTKVTHLLTRMPHTDTLFAPAPDPDPDPDSDSDPDPTIIVLSVIIVVFVVLSFLSPFPTE